jgi:hypothetical protein
LVVRSFVGDRPEQGAGVMCDVCKATGHALIYSISYLTGERLVLCGICATHCAEPITTVIHGVNAGALEPLPGWVKKRITVYMGGRYVGLRKCALVLQAQVRALPPPPSPDEVRMETKLIRMMDAAKKAPFDPPLEPTKRRLFLSSLRQKILAFYRHAFAGHNGEPAHAVNEFSKTYAYPQ